jgi:GT2 family glycosyltransferase/glycosyltransferase involved in cell wall biosynthesis
MLSRQIELITQGIRIKLKPNQTTVLKINDIHVNPIPQPHKSSVDIIIYFYNAMTDFQGCLESVLKYTPPPFSITVVDDGSDEATRSHLVDLAKTHQFRLLYNDSTLGYTQSMSCCLQQSSTEFAILLNSNIIVTPGWLDGMLACAQSDPKIGLVGTLSNRLINQPKPGIITHGVWADSIFPESVLPTQRGALITKYSGRLYPEMNYLNNSCLLIRRQANDQIGNFGDDYCLRARNAGWKLALADDTYIFQDQPDSNSHEEPSKLVELTDDLGMKQQSQFINDGGKTENLENRILEGISSHNRYIMERENLIQQGREQFINRRVLFVLPVTGAGGGSNLVFLITQAMQKMGVDAQIMNLHIYRQTFERAYPNPTVPLFFGNAVDVPNIAINYDAIVATSNTSVSWIAPALEKRADLVTGYYIQDYEPYFYPPDSTDHRDASSSYTLIPKLVRCVTTQWIADQILHHHNEPCHIIGAHMDTDLFRPRPLTGSAWPDRPLRITAMIRPISERRSPRLTMDILQQASKMYGSRLEFILFGCQPGDPGFAPLPQDFPWHLAGELRPAQIANLLNESDIFVDFSTYQALGLTALESMSCGLATIVPIHGGTGIFAKHEENCLVVDTQDQAACFNALQRLIEDDVLRLKLQWNAISTAAKFYPELPAFNMLKALFLENK